METILYYYLLYNLHYSSDIHIRHLSMLYPVCVRIGLLIDCMAYSADSKVVVDHRKADHFLFVELTNKISIALKYRMMKHRLDFLGVFSKTTVTIVSVLQFHWLVLLVISDEKKLEYISVDGNAKATTNISGAFIANCQQKCGSFQA